VSETVLNYKNNNSEFDSQVVRFGQPEMITAAIGLVALTFGVLVYVFDRSATAVYFVPDSWRVAESTPVLFGQLGMYLPAFFHALAFALFINVVAGRRYIGFMCISWFIAEVFFELAQIDPIAFRISGVLPAWFANLPILQNISSHFLTGTFDRVDILFLLLGCATAYAICRTALPRLHKGLPTRRLLPTRMLRLVVLMLVTFVGLTSIVSSGGTGRAVLTIVKAPVSTAPQKLQLRDASLSG